MCVCVFVRTCNMDKTKSARVNSFLHAEMYSKTVKYVTFERKNHAVILIKNFWCTIDICELQISATPTANTS